MNTEQSNFQPGFWRNASRPLNVNGIPAPLFLLYLFFFRFPYMETIYVVTAFIAVFPLLSKFGWTFKTFFPRVIYLIRGKNLSGRPWWYRRFEEGDNL